MRQPTNFLIENTVMQNVKNSDDFYWDGYEDALNANPSHPPKNHYRNSYLKGYQSGAVEMIANKKSKKSSKIQSRTKYYESEYD